MEAMAILQRRLIETQQSIERDYLRLRHVEAKFRTLFETSNESVLLVDGSSYRVLDANGNAQLFAKDSSKKLVGRDLYECFEPASREDLQSLLRMAHATGRVEMCRARFAGASQDCSVSASVFRQENGPQFLVRLLAQDAVPAKRAGANPQSLFAQALEQSPDGFVLTDRSGHIQSANAEFLSMLGATALSQLYGQPLENWLLRGGVDWGVLLTNLRSQAMVKEFATSLRQMSGSPMAVEISALSLAGDEPFYAFYVRDVVRRRAQETPSSTGMAGSVAELSHLVGRMPMKDIVGETIDMIEKMCIQSALELTGNNRASAAEMLGLSRQSLYVKLRRFGMVSETDPSGMN
jgi:transcriptional regulator PpsR